MFDVYLRELVGQTVTQYFGNHSRDLAGSTLKDPNTPPEIAMHLWQRDNKETIKAAMADPGPTAQTGMSSYSRASAKLWAKVNKTEKERYELMAKELNAGTATDEEKRA